jgi:hypothetical protein
MPPTMPLTIPLTMPQTVPVTMPLTMPPSFLWCWQPRDVTPEATRPLLQRPAPGLVIAMMTYGLKVRAVVVLLPVNVLRCRRLRYSCCLVDTTVRVVLV